MDVLKNETLSQKSFNYYFFFLHFEKGMYPTIGTEKQISIIVVTNRYSFLSQSGFSFLLLQSQ